ncbi:MAG: DNA polymerase III subunit gamma/tau [Lachnospiraceae bacterium]|nr:DNA polymerase III subunit gamma/tau [Lachnospiraceae bacterium]
MSYVALYRKARPKTFDEVVGQEAVVRTLKNQVRTGRVQHAYLFSGTRGTGKTSVAKILARAVNCEHPEDGNPCNSCKVCSAISAGNSMNVIEIDAASNNGVDNIRQIIEEVQYRPTQGNYKVYIIDEVHMLSTGAFNALLKTLEEPPSYVIFILATTEAGRIPVTILSRCQKYDFHRISAAQIVEHMRELLDQEGVQAEDRALQFVARAAEGSMRDALSLLDQCMAFYMGQELTYERVLAALGAADTEVFGHMVRRIVRQDAAGCVRIFEKQVAAGVEIGQFIGDFQWYLRNLLMVLSGAGEQDVDVTREQFEELETLAAQTGPDAVMRMIRVLSDLTNTMRYATNRRVPAEVALVRLCRPQMEEGGDTRALSERISYLESRIEELLRGGVTISPSQAVVPPGETVEEAASENENTAEPAPCAAPAELKEIAAGWPRIISMLEDGLMKVVLKDSIPQYNTGADDHRLYIEVASNLGGTLVGKEFKIRMIEDAIEKLYGRHVDLELHFAEERPKGLAEITVEKVLQERVHMDIVEDDDDEEE